MLIVEGTDLVGKSTLCKKLLKVWNENYKTYGAWPVVGLHLDKPPNGFHPYKSYLPLISRCTMWDRFHLSDLCYGAVCRGEKENSKITPYYLRMLEAHLVLAGSLTIVITSTEKRLKKEFERKQRQEMYDLKTILEANEQYIALCEGDVERWKEARVDYRYELNEEDGGWPSDKDGWINEILQEWSNRLAGVYSTNMDCFYGLPSSDVLKEP